jgi:hypothetical protein
MFLSAALYNWLVAGIFGIGHQPLFAAFGIAPVPTPPLYFHLFLGAVALFGYMYYRVSRDLTQTLLVQLGVAGKSLVFAIVAAYGVAGIASWHLIALATVDLLYVLLFVGFLRSQRCRASATADHSGRSVPTGRAPKQ